MTKRMPALFVGHGNPMNAVEDSRFSRGWEQLGRELPRPKAILAVSAHWYTHGWLVNDAAVPETIYDMYGFPQALYDVRYPAPGSPEVAARVRELASPNVRSDDGWGIDHGVWSVLHRMFPAADVPVVELSVNGDASPEEHFALGRELSGLRDEGVMILGSGNVVHNLALVDWASNGGYAWADEFDAWVRDHILARDFAPVVAYREVGEDAARAVPTPEHFLPLPVVLGTVRDDDSIRVTNDGRELGSMSMTSYLFE